MFAICDQCGHCCASLVVSRTYLRCGPAGRALVIMGRKAWQFKWKWSVNFKWSSEAANCSLRQLPSAILQHHSMATVVDDWGCGSSFSETKTLSELVEGLTSKKITEHYAEQLPFPTAEAENKHVQVVPCVLKAKNAAPKILKKKSSLNKINKEPNLKKVTFEVGQLLARESTGVEKEEATERLVVSLGGHPSKKKSVNYKQYKDDLERKKNDVKQKEITFAPNRVIKKKAKN